MLFIAHQRTVTTPLPTASETRLNAVHIPNVVGIWDNRSLITATSCSTVRNLVSIPVISLMVLLPPEEICALNVVSQGDPA